MDQDRMTLKKGKIVMLANSTHPPLDTRIFQKEAKTLFAAGFEVSIIVPHTEDFIRDGIQIIAVPLHKKGLGKLIVNPWNVFKKAWHKPRGCFFHIHDSELLVIGMLLRITGHHVVYDAHEDTPQQISYQHWIPWLLKKPYAWFYFLLEKICGWSFDAIIVAEPVIRKYFPFKKTTLIRNFPMISSFRDVAFGSLPDRERKLVYVGLLSKARGLTEMMEGALMASPKVSFEFVIGGQFAPPSLESEILKKYPVTFLGWVSYDKLIPLLFSSRVGIIIPNPIERYKTNYPVKLFEYMGAGLPVIASNLGESSGFVKEGDCGILVDPLNPAEVANAIIELMTDDAKAKDMGERGRKLVFEKYNWEKEGEELVKVYEKLFQNVNKIN
jgi:glycosyltransferase involved in cell wall biosynthesis